MKKTWIPLRDLVMVKRLDHEEKTSSGIYLPEKSRVDSTKGVILACGPKVSDVKVGDVVMFGPWSDLLTLNDEIAIFPEGDCRWIERSMARSAS